MSGSKSLYRYSVDGKLQLRPVPHWQQGIAYLDGYLYFNADDGDADLDEADNLWRAPADPAASPVFVEHVWEFSEFLRAGEIEGISFDRTTGELPVLSNHGARIVLGMPSGFYPGHDREVHEVYVMTRPRWGAEWGARGRLQAGARPIADVGRARRPSVTLEFDLSPT